MNKPRQFRQGDVLLVEAAIPKGRKLRSSTSIMVAEGEVTGHAHVLRPGEHTKVLTDKDAEFVRVLNGIGLLTHEEHTTIEVPEGDYRVVRQREYTPEEIRRVAD